MIRGGTKAAALAAHPQTGSGPRAEISVTLGKVREREATPKEVKLELFSVSSVTYRGQCVCSAQTASHYVMKKLSLFPKDDA